MTDVVEKAFSTLNIHRDALLPEIHKLVNIKFKNAIDEDIVKLYQAREIVLSVARYEQCESMELIDDGEMTSFQSLLLFILGRMKEQGFRRKGDKCYEQIIIDGIPTGAWQFGYSIREFIGVEIRKDMEPKQFRNLTNSRENLDALVRHLCDVTHREFPILVENEHLISFRNGTFDTKHSVFFPFAKRDEWQVLAEGLQEERRRQGWGTHYQLECPNDSNCACNFVNKHFREINESTRPLLDDICDLLECIGIPPEIHGWFHVFMGRLFFPVNTNDRWQVMPFLKTNEISDNAALTTIMDVIRSLIGDLSVASVISGVNCQQSLELLMNARVSCILLRDNAPLEQGDWQLAVCGEHVCINTKNKAPFPHQWKSHLLGAGPVLPYKNDAGTVDRRVIMFDVSKASVELFQSLKSKIIDNIDLWVQSIVTAYLTAANDYGFEDIWGTGVLPPQIHETREKVRELCNPLHSCAVSQSFRREPTLFMPLSDFKDIYYEFRRCRSLPLQRWVRDHWQAAFQDLGLAIERGQKEYHGVKSTTDWLCGIDTVERVQEHTTLVTQQSIDAMKVEVSRLGRETELLERRIDISQKLLDAETEIAQQKECRTRLRQQLSALNQSNHV